MVCFRPATAAAAAVRVRTTADVWLRPSAGETAAARYASAAATYASAAARYASAAARYASAAASYASAAARYASALSASSSKVWVTTVSTNG